MGTIHYAIVEQQSEKTASWWFISFWDLGKDYKISMDVHEIRPSKGSHVQWPDELGELTEVLGRDRYYKTWLERDQLPDPTDEHSEVYRALFESVRYISGHVRVLFCQDQ